MSNETVNSEETDRCTKSRCISLSFKHYLTTFLLRVHDISVSKYDSFKDKKLY